MFWRTPQIRIDHVDRIDLDSFAHPIVFDLLRKYLKSSEALPPPYPQYFLHSESAPAKTQQSGWFRYVDVVGKVVSILSGLAVIAFLLLLWSGRTAIANVSIGTLLTGFSFTLIGGFISVGGVKMFSLTANLRKAQERIREVVSSAGGCPFVYIVDDEARKRYDITDAYHIGNGDFCNRCQLVDQNGRTTCRVSPLYRQ
jgi:hypothetical protein